MKDDPSPAPAAPPAVTSRLALRANGLALLALLGVALCALVAYPLLSPLLWAMVLAVVAMPLLHWTERRIRQRSVATALVVAVVALLVTVPVVLVATQLLAQVSDAAEAMRPDGAARRAWNEMLAGQPALAKLVGTIDRLFDLGDIVAESKGGAANALQKALNVTVTGAAGWLIAFFLLFYFLRDRQAAQSALERYLPLRPAEVRELFGVAADTVHATVWGTMAVAVVQGTLGGLMFWALGLPGPLLWGVVMGLLSVLPLLGAALVWLPAAGWLALQGQWTPAVLLVGFGTIVIGLIDNLIYPLIVKGRMHLHTVPVFVAIIGGLFVFGASGIVFGPLLLALTDRLVRIWRRRLSAADPRG